jgi:uncharacterized damage-inducible protein DinB
MAAYNAEMNRRRCAAAATLSDDQRKADGGAFWGSVHGTLSHILFGDRMWMHRLDGWERPAAPLADSAAFVPDFGEFRAARAEADAGIQAWAARLDPEWLAGELTWFSGATRREWRQPRWLLVTHLFNHQTHHRGQAHALLTRAGANPGVTDLPFA